MSGHLNAYLTFALGSHTFGVHVEKVVEIREYITPKPVPESLPYVKGVIDHRDHIIPLIDAGVKFNMGPVEVTPQSCIVVLEIIRPGNDAPFMVSILVDQVSDVFESDNDKIKAIENDFKPGYILATYKNNDVLVMILNTDKVFTEKDIIAMTESIEALD